MSIERNKMKFENLHIISMFRSAGKTNYLIKFSETSSPEQKLRYINNMMNNTDKLDKQFLEYLEEGHNHSYRNIEKINAFFNYYPLN